MRGKTSWIYKMATDFFRVPAWPTYEKLSPRLSASLFHPRGFCRLLARYPERSPLRAALRNDLGNESEMDVTEECSNAHVLWTACTKIPCRKNYYQNSDLPRTEFERMSIICETCTEHRAIRHFVNEKSVKNQVLEKSSKGHMVATV